MIRLNPDDLAVVSFETSVKETVVLEATGTNVVQCWSPWCAPTVRKTCTEG